MIHNDEIYGSVEIGELLLVNLIESAVVQRMKGISQHGITALLGITPSFSRFDHSMGVMLLVRRLGGSIDEQIAALLHDISHTAFSHVIDFVFDDSVGQSYHEEKKEAFVAESDIPAILQRHGLEWRDFMAEDQFSLLEQPSPALCADRLDYFLRDLEWLKLARAEDIQAAIQALDVCAGQIICTDPDVARWLAYTYIEADQTSWSSFREVGLYQVTAEAIKAARRLGMIEEADIWHSDRLLWEKLQAIDHPQVRQWVELISPGTRFYRDEQQPLFRISTRIRSIDPLIGTDNGPLALSELDTCFARYRDEYHHRKQGVWPMSIIGAHLQTQ